MSRIDIIVGDGPSNSSDGRSEGKPAPKPFLGINFVCANGAYGRAYRNPDGTAYEGRCPSCMKKIRIGIAPGGTSSRFFDYDCGR